MNAKTQPQPAGWSIEGWAGFWAAPTIEVARTRIPLVCASSITGYWPRQPEPVRGVSDYCQHIVDLLTMIPDLRLKLEEHAINGEFVFARWSGSGTGPEARFEINGVDRIRVHDGKVIENRIISDASIFEHFARYVADRKKGRPATAA
jgi:hypothetical protein